MVFLVRMSDCMQYCYDYYPWRIKLCEESGLSFLEVAPRYGSTLQVVEGKIQKKKSLVLCQATELSEKAS